MGWSVRCWEAALEKVQSPFLPVGDFKIVSQESRKSLQTRDHRDVTERYKEATAISVCCLG